MATRTGTSQTQQEDITFGDVNLPPALQNLLNLATGQISDVMNRYPLMTVMQNLAEQIIPLTPLELQLLGQQIATSQAPSITYPELAGLTDINQLIGGPIGSSPATLAGMQAFQQLTAPSIAQSAALAGQNRGGGFIESMQQGSTAAALPLIQQEIADRVGVLPQLMGLGGTIAGRERGDIATALGAAQEPRQIAQSQATANWQDVQRRANLIQGLSTGVFGQIAPATIGPPSETITSTGTGSSKTTTPGIWTSLGKK